MGFGAGEAVVLGRTIASPFFWLWRQIRHRPRLKLTCTRWQFRFAHVDSWGGVSLSDNPAGARDAEYEFDIEILNSGPKQTVIRDFRVGFRSGGDTIHTDHKLKVRQQPKTRENWPDVTRLTIAGDDAEMIRGWGKVPKHDLQDLLSHEKVSAYFIYRDISGKNRDLFIGDVPAASS